MADIYKVNTPIRKPLFEGVQGENEARSIVFDITPWVEELGDGAVTATSKRSQDSQPYPVTVTKDGTTVTWKPTSTDTAFAGVGSFQLEYTVDSVLAKTCIWSTMVAPSLDPAGDPPDPYDNWLAEMREIAADAIQAAQDADASADDAQASADAAAAIVPDIENEIAALKASTDEIVGIKSGVYANNYIKFFQGTMNTNTGEFIPGQANRTTSDFLYIPTGVNVNANSFTLGAGYGKSNPVWFDAYKTYISSGAPTPSNARYVRVIISKLDNSNLTPSDAQANTTYTIVQPVSVEGLKSDLDTLGERVEEIGAWYDVYNKYVVEKEDITSKIANGKFGSGKNGATYSNGVLTIPANSTGAVSYIGVRLTGGFALLKNNVARIKITFDDLSGVDLGQKTLQSPNNTSVHIIDFNISLETNTVEYTLLLDSDSFSYLFFGIEVVPTASAQTSQKVITYQSATIYSSESYDNHEKRALKLQLFGDSITDDVRIVNGSETLITTWASSIAEYMSAYDITVVNSAVGGSGIGHGKSSTARYSTKTYNYVHDLVTDGTLETNSDVIVILIGTNNWRGEGGGAYNALGQLGDDNSGSTKTFYGYLDQICKYISDNSEARVIWATPPQRYNSADQSSPTNSLGEALNNENHTLKQFCDAIKEVAALYGMKAIDLNDSLGWNKYNVADFTSDGLHPSATKCYRITEVICGALKAYIGD